MSAILEHEVESEFERLLAEQFRMALETIRDGGTEVHNLTWVLSIINYPPEWARRVLVDFERRAT